MKPIIFEGVQFEEKDHKPIDWIDNKYVSCRVLFPYWMCASVLLNNFVEKTQDWVVNSHQSEINCGLKFPLVYDEISKKMVPMLNSFPIEDQPKVVEICLKLMSDYSPNVNHYLRQKLTEQVLHEIRSEIRSRECHILANGGWEIKKELAFRLGVWPTDNIKFKLEVSNDTN